MVESIRSHISDNELKRIQEYGNKITIRPFSLEFAIDVPSDVIKNIFDLFDVWLKDYHNNIISISHEDNTFLNKHNKKPVYEDERMKISVEELPLFTAEEDNGLTVDMSSLYAPFFKELGVNVNTSETSLIYNKYTAPIDYIPSLFADSRTIAVTADNSLIYGNESAPVYPNTTFFDLFFRALTSPQYIEKGHKSNTHEKIDVTKTGTDITIKRTVKGKGGTVAEIQSIKISNLNFYKRNKKTVLIFSYLFQKLAGTPGANSVYISYSELVDLGMYETIDGARRGVNNFYDYFHGTDGNKKTYIPGVSVSGKFKTKERKQTIQMERDLVTGRDLAEGGQVIYLNSELNLTIFTAYTSFLPLWAYRLENLDAFLLVRYIFYTARMKGGNFSDPEKADQNDKHPYKYFTLVFDSIRDALGLPSPVDVVGRKYKEKIKDPIESAIEDVEKEIARINSPEKSILVTLTPKGTDATNNIEEYLRCKLEIGIVDTFANSFIEASVKHEKKVQDYRKRIEKEKAKKASKK